MKILTQIDADLHLLQILRNPILWRMLEWRWSWDSLCYARGGGCVKHWTELRWRLVIKPPLHINICREAKSISLVWNLSTRPLDASHIQVSTLRRHLHYAGKIWRRFFISTVRPEKLALSRFSAPSWWVGKAVRNYSVCMGIRRQITFLYSLIWWINLPLSILKLRLINCAKFNFEKSFLP